MTVDPRGFLQEQAPWLLDPELSVCIVGSSALQIACDSHGVEGPSPADLDLSWALDLAAGESVLRQHGVFVETTAANRGRGTLAMKLAGSRLEITSFRGSAPSEPDLRERIRADLSERDMTVGALACSLATGEVFDPFQGLDDWVGRRVAPVGACRSPPRTSCGTWPASMTLPPKGCIRASGSHPRMKSGPPVRAAPPVWRPGSPTW